MKGICFDGKKAVYREDLPKPTPGEGESLVRVLMAAVCNTDKEILRGYRPDFKGVMGHEFVGVAEESSDAAIAGKRVVGELNAACGKCIYCRTGRPTHCSGRRVLGMHDKDGCFAEYMTIDTSLLHPVPEELPTEKAIYTEPLAAAFEIMTQVSLGQDKNIAVLGDGRLAYCVVQALRAEGHSVTVAGKHPEKLELFRPFAEVTLEREKEGYEVVIEATGSPSGILQALEMVRKKGTVVLKSTYAGEVSLPLSQVAVNEISIVGSRCGPFVPALNALASGKALFPEITLFAPKEYEQVFADTGFKAGFRFS
ncbi:MAG: alcohol dehydrogenase catalytic domain-containing protein [Lachnospiraceae bacterium]|jgi:threonine dehydrogenase-like Zn-dependent dehydrogenase|nr:alcohol dehydrogenase catalytic domain-containing protein [Lachnospiraceae bacterium]